MTSTEHQVLSFLQTFYPYEAAVRLDMTIEETGLDSLELVELQLMLEEYYVIDLEKASKKWRTVRDVVGTVGRAVGC